ncbi:SIMPL domain-containing protein [Robertkochia sediminum]|uniref:SIMPL domain-containing protein n=1 Tax=Robertkochia sediminum TaxID=2785326 RepID=UPI0019343AFE|nr:SIMPL domain-containing protein [Robertkochia sediminum]MBL7473498.1 SIMPL domain-containing protein [Robertkochia sediminum]
MKRILIAFALGFFSLITLQAQGSDVSTITVTGEGIVRVVPDRADLYFGIRTEGQEVALVKKENDSLVMQLLDMLYSMGIDKKDVQTKRLNLHKNYDHRKKEETYYANQSLMVRIHQLTQYEEITAALLASGVNQIERVVFGHSDRETFEDQARSKAVSNAMKKVKGYAAAMGRKTGDFMKLEELGAHDPAPVYRMAMDESSGGAGEAFAMGEIEVIAKVRLVQDLK